MGLAFDKMLRAVELSLEAIHCCPNKHMRIE